MFKEINEMIAAGQSVSITIHKTGVNMTVTVLHLDNGVKDDAVKKIKPLTLTGTAEELDEGFVSEITRPLQLSGGIISNIAEYEKGVEAAAGSTKAAKEVSDIIGKMIKDAEKYETDGKLSEALAEYKKVLEKEPKHSKASRKVDELTNSLSQTSLF
ncbi:PRTRC genetic system protein E [Dysgonomonas hofstadii]|uniref:PRTRC genetic system protein E n=1 Tax=Dysgonomonas hofstadii TaxID=637886 RepID=A0A840CVU0_9BACT|nr:PRTRC system protein E [Dysgonomonas hofstadii]MBB4036592.1 PRTRC genetic system protein E [Dysgonomonas hofstadii]